MHKIHRVHVTDGLRAPKKCPACGSTQFGLAGRAAGKIRFACKRCGFESVLMAKSD